MMEAFGQSVALVYKTDFVMFEKGLSSSCLIKYLVEDGLLDPDLAQTTLKEIEERKIALTHYLSKNNILSSQTILQCCIKHFDLPVFDLKNYRLEWLQESLVKPDLMYKHRIIPLYRDENYLYLGMADPTDHPILAKICFQTGLQVHPMLISENELEEIIATYYFSYILSEEPQPYLIQEEQSIYQEKAAQEPVIKWVDCLIQDAIHKKASDIHIEPYENHCRIRFRRDGLLQEITTIPIALAHLITLRLKLMGHLNIAERRLPQDGHIIFNTEYHIDLRISTCPTLFGEKIVLRLLDSHHFHTDIHQLGLDETQKKIFLDKLTHPQGLILATGPTGSGKTMTLYSALHFLNQTEKNISTVEDPIEIKVNGLNQININQKINLDFATILRALLRQDPDIIMVGEIRDCETAHIAIQAAQTGHLVLSTLHTNSAAETMIRLQSMGIDTTHLYASLSLVIAQRLVRLLCHHCKKPIPDTISTDNFSHPIYQAIGCKNCHQGYLGRIAIFELLPVEIIHQLLLNKTLNNTQSIIDEMKKHYLPLLIDSARKKIQEGYTSIAEITRVLGL